MKRINTGKIINGKYVKMVNFSKAVLWMTKELSLRRSIILTLNMNGIDELVFEDRKKGEKWTFKMKDIMNCGSLKKVGQEEQFYFPIEIAKKEKISQIL